MRKPHTLFLGVLFLAFSLITLYPMWQGAIIWNTIEYATEFYDKYERPLDILIAFFAFYILIVYKIKMRSEMIYILLYALFNAISIIINGRSSGYFSIVAIPLIYLLLSNIKNSYYFNWNKFILIVLLIWIITPIIDCFFFSDISRQLLFFREYGGYSFFDAGFSGYAVHKNVYAYIVGLCFLITIFTKLPKYVKYLIWVILVGALALSLCKSVIITLVVVVLYYKMINESIGLKLSNRHVILVIVLFSIAIACFVSLDFFNDPNRTVLINGFIDVIKNNFLFGTGMATVVPARFGDDMMPAHNLILQGLADRGIIAFMLYCIYIKCFFSNSDKVYRLFLLYMLLNGLFQPYYTIAIPDYLMMITFLLPMFMSIPVRKIVPQSVR